MAISAECGSSYGLRCSTVCSSLAAALWLQLAFSEFLNTVEGAGFGSGASSHMNQPVQERQLRGICCGCPPEAKLVVTRSRASSVVVPFAPSRIKN